MMETLIHAPVLKELMRRQNLTQEALAARSGIGIATIKRICAGKHSPKGQRSHTLKTLASALNVRTDDLLNSELPPPEENQHLRENVAVKSLISRQTDLSYQAVEALYGISRSAQMAMAPLFAALVAEASLKWRRERLGTLGSIADKLDGIHRDNPLLRAAFVRACTAEQIEKSSIERKDVLGHAALRDLEDNFASAIGNLDVQNDYSEPTTPDQWVSPFALFLKDFAASLGPADIEIHLSDEHDDPRVPDGTLDYRVGAALLDELCGPGGWGKIAIEYGYSSLSDIPPGLRSPDKARERHEFLSARMNEDQKREFAKARVTEHMAYAAARLRAKSRTSDMVGDDLTPSGDDDTVEITDEMIRQEMELISDGDAA